MPTKKPRKRVKRKPAPKAINHKKLSFPRLLLPLFLVVFLVWLAGFLTWRIFPHAFQNLDIFEVGEGETYADLSFSPKSLTLAKDTEAEVALNLDPHGLSVSAVQIELVYNPSELVLTALTPTSHLSTVLLQPKIENGLAKVALGSNVQSPQTQSGSLATIRLKPLKEGTFYLAYGSSTMVAAIQSQDDILGDIDTLTITTPNAPSPTPYPDEDLEEDEIDEPNDSGRDLTNNPQTGNPASSPKPASINQTITNIFTPKDETPLDDPLPDMSGPEDSDPSQYEYSLGYPEENDFSESPTQKPNLFRQALLGWQIIISSLRGVLTK